MRDAFSRAIAPFATVLLLPGADMVVVQMLHQLVHVLEIAMGTPFPFAHRHLFLAEFILLRHAGVVVWRCRNGSICVL